MILKRSFAALRMTFLLSLLLCSRVSAQSAPWIQLGAHGVLAYTTVDPVPGDRSLGEVRLVQPTIMAHGGIASNRLRMLATLNLEGLTIPDGELTPGAWGKASSTGATPTPTCTS